MTTQRTPDELAAFLEQKKREVEERLRKIQEQQRLQAAQQASTSKTTTTSSSTSTSRTDDAHSATVRRLAEVKARVQAEAAKHGLHPYNPSRSIPSVSLGSRQRSGLAVPAHPLIAQLTEGTAVIETTSSKKSNPLAGNLPKASFATVKANQRLGSKKEIKLLEAPADFSDPNKNPYFDPNLASSGPRTRHRRQFNFVGPGTYVRQAEKMRAQAQLERLRREIAESAQRAGMEVELDIAADKQIRGDPPPDVEWWDEPLLANHSYDDIATGNILLSGDRTLVTAYIQHPVPIPSPQDLKPKVVRPLMLTKKERKKLRRQHRLERLKEKQDKIRLGLLPPEPPKVKLSNLMRVLGSEAIQDPTKMEAYVRNEVRKRQEKHMRANEERKLTPEQRREKRQKKLEEDAAKGIHVLVFRINDLTHPQQKFKVETNANQLALTGVAIIHSRFSLVIVEGGPKSINTYKKLMLRRIKWRDPDSEILDDAEDTNSMAVDGAPAGGRPPNRCVLVWEGQVAGRSFKNFRFRRCPTETAAKEALQHNRAAHYWDIARNIREEDLLGDSNEVV